MVMWFVADRDPRGHLAGARAGRADGDRPAARGGVLRGEPDARLRRSRRGVPGRHRRRSAVCRHGAFRQASDPDRVVRAGAARAAAELFRAGRAAAHQPEGDRAAVLPAGAAVGALSAGRPGDRGRDHRLAGAHLRRVLADPPGDSARLQPAARHRAHLVGADRPGLRAAGQLGADDQHDPDRHRLRIVNRARRRLRHRRHADDGDHDRAAVRRRHRSLALATCRGVAGHGRLPVHRSRVLRAPTC